MLVPVLANQLVVRAAAMGDLVHGVLAPHQRLGVVEQHEVTTDGGGYGVQVRGLHLDDHAAVNVMQDLVGGHVTPLVG